MVSVSPSPELQHQCKHPNVEMPGSQEVKWTQNRVRSLSSSCVPKSRAPASLQTRNKPKARLPARSPARQKAHHDLMAAVSQSRAGHQNCPPEVGGLLRWKLNSVALISFEKQLKGRRARPRGAKDPSPHSLTLCTVSFPLATSGAWTERPKDSYSPTHAEASGSEGAGFRHCGTVNLHPKAAAAKTNCPRVQLLPRETPQIQS